MSDKVAILILNYNMPERTDALAEAVIRRVQWPYELFVIDNGSDLVEPSGYTNIFIPDNVQVTGGWLAGLKVVESWEEFMALWLLITSAEFPEEDDFDPLAPMAQLMLADTNIVGIHPALTEDSTTSWTHLKARGGSDFRRTWMIDNIAALWRADWFDKIGRFDPEMEYAWGIDLETCLKARRQGRSLYICEASRIKKVTDIGYSMDRMHMQAGERHQKAGDSMREVLSKKYGPAWWQIMTGSFVESAWL